MRKYYWGKLAVTALLSASVTYAQAQGTHAILLEHVNLIKGDGTAPVSNTDILIQGDTFAQIGEGLHAPDARVLDMQGKTIMPALISDHVHIGNVKGLTQKAENYTRDNILHQLKKYEEYGVLNVLVMGSDRKMLFTTGLRDSSQAGLLDGARLHSAAFGFGVPDGAPPAQMGMDMVFRPSSVNEIAKDMDSLSGYKPTLVKLWVDDFGGRFVKMKPEIYKEIIIEAHRHGLRAAAHAYYLGDVRQLVDDGVDIIAHSVRDSIIDDALIQKIRDKNIVYIPTLSLDEFAYIYARRPEWVDDAFFRASLEPGVYELITSQKYQDNLKNAPDYMKNVQAFKTAQENLKKLHDAGILIALGTDSGAMPIRTQGFSEHLEMQLMTEAGLTPLQAIQVATDNAARVLGVSDQYGTIEKGKKADFIVLNADPSKNIRNTRDIAAVYKAGVEVSHGPVSR